MDFPIRNRPFLASFLILSASALAFVPQAARAQMTLAQNTSSTNIGPAYFGQSLTTPTGGMFNHLVFNFYSNTSGGTANTVAAPGTVFLLTQAYSGTPTALSSSTAGYVAQATGSGGLYTFASGVTVTANTQYFFYENAQANLTYQDADPYSGGNYYVSTGNTISYTINPNRDLAFRLQGTVVPADTPEPGSLSLLGIGLVTGLGMVGTVRHCKAKAKPTL